MRPLFLLLVGQGLVPYTGSRRLDPNRRAEPRETFSKTKTHQTTRKGKRGQPPNPNDPARRLNSQEPTGCKWFQSLPISSKPCKRPRFFRLTSPGFTRKRYVGISSDPIRLPCLLALPPIPRGNLKYTKRDNECQGFHDNKAEHTGITMTGR